MTMTPIPTVVFALDPLLIKSRVPSDSRILGSTNTAEAMLNLMYRIEKVSLWHLLKEKLLTHGFNIEYIENFEESSLASLKNKIVVVIDTLQTKNALKKIRATAKELILYAYEPDTMDPKAHKKSYQDKFDKILTFDQRLVDNQKVFGYLYPVQRQMRSDLVAFHSRRLCCLIASNKCCPGPTFQKRQELIQYFEKNYPDQFDLFGRGWPSSLIYKGEIENKDETIKNYKFVLCPENTDQIPGYITEKLWDAFANGVIPIYLGHEKVTHTIPSNCFIDLRQFSSWNCLYDVLSQMTEEKHQLYLEAIQQFLRSYAAQQFSKEAFIEHFVRAVITN